MIAALTLLILTELWVIKGDYKKRTKGEFTPMDSPEFQEALKLHDDLFKALAANDLVKASEIIETLFDLEAFLEETVIQTIKTDYMLASRIGLDLLDRVRDLVDACTFRYNEIAHTREPVDEKPSGVVIPFRRKEDRR